MGKRKDTKGRVLEKGESQRKDGSYMYRWTDNKGQRQTVYATTLNELREKKLPSPFIPEQKDTETELYHILKGKEIRNYKV